MTNGTGEGGGWLLYGASGFSGALIARSAVAMGLRPVLGGRNAASLAPLADDLGLTFRVCAVHDAQALDAALEDVGLVLNAAGPFTATASALVDACLRRGADYLDLTGEVEVVESLARQGERARRRGIMVMPGVGLDVVAGDCLGLHVARRLERPQRLAIAVQGLRGVSRGTARTIVAAAGGGHARRDGRLEAVGIGSLERGFDFGRGPVACLNVAWADVASAWYTTGIANIDVYCEATIPLRMMSAWSRAMGPLLATGPWQAWLDAQVALLPPGPNADERQHGSLVFVAEVEDCAGRRRASRMRTPEAYTFTERIAPRIAARVLRGDREPGFQTPARVYGADLALDVAGVTREDLS